MARTSEAPHDGHAVAGDASCVAGSDVLIVVDTGWPQRGHGAASIEGLIGRVA